jgi:hypothetical protein
MSHFPNWTVFNASWTFLTERFDKYISDNGDVLNKGMMFIDKNSRMPNSEITKIVNRLRRNGSSYQNIDYIHEDPSYVTSNDRPLLQIADAISYCTLKQLCRHKWFKTYWFPRFFNFCFSDSRKCISFVSFLYFCSNSGKYSLDI